MGQFDLRTILLGAPLTLLDLQGIALNHRYFYNEHIRFGPDYGKYLNSRVSKI